MKPFPAPTAPGHYWAKLVHPVAYLVDQLLLARAPAGMPEGEDWQSVDFEVVQVWDNNGEGNQKWGVSVPGIDVTQWVEDFVWGPKVEVPQIPGFRERTF